MKRIVLLVCGMLFLVSNTADAGWFRRTSGRTYTQPARVTTATCSTCTVQPARVATTAPTTHTAAKPVQATTASYSASAARVTTASYSTSSAQGVANLMASSNRVGHWGGNPGYEGCGAGPTAAAAYNNCCYSRSGMSTVDVGYARSASGTWFCCRRYR